MRRSVEIEIIGERVDAFWHLRKRALQLDGLLTFLHAAGDSFDGSHRDYVMELAADIGFEIRELVELINDAQAGKGGADHD